ncbi:schlafen-like protein 1 [Lissotriton helveticus]
MDVLDDLQNMENMEREVLSREDVYHVDPSASDQFKENLPKVDLPKDDLTEDLLREDLSKELAKEDQAGKLPKEDVTTEHLPKEYLEKEDLLREDLAKELLKKEEASEQLNKDLAAQDIPNKHLATEELLRQDLAKDLSQKDQVSELPREDLATENLSNEYPEKEDLLREDLAKEILMEHQPREVPKEDLTKEGLPNEQLETDDLLGEDRQNEETLKRDLVEEELSNYNLSQDGLSKGDISEQDIPVQSGVFSTEEVLKVDPMQQHQSTKNHLHEEEQSWEELKTDILLREAQQQDHSPSEDVSSEELLNEDTSANLLPKKDPQTDELLIESLSDKPSALSLYVGNLNSRFSKEVLTCMLKDILAGISVNLQRHDIEIIKKGKNAYAFVHLENESSYQTVMTQFHNPSNLEQSLLKELVKKGKTLKVSEVKSNFPITETTSSKRKSVKKSKMGEESLKLSGSGTSFPVGEWTDQMSGIVAGTKSESAIVKQHIKGKEHFYYGALLGSETRNVEFKRGGGEYLIMTFKHHIRKYTCGFLNSEGGSLFVGVEDSGAVLGVHCNHKEEDRLRLLVDSILKGFKPPLFPDAYSLAFIPVLKAEDTGLFLKVIRLTVHRPKEQNEPLLYETDQGEVYLRRDGSIQGPLSGNAIQEWCRQKWMAELRRLEERSGVLLSEKMELQETLHSQSLNALQEPKQTGAISKRKAKSTICRIM